MILNSVSQKELIKIQTKLIEELDKKLGDFVAVTDMSLGDIDFHVFWRQDPDTIFDTYGIAISNNGLLYGVQKTGDNYGFFRYDKDTTYTGNTLKIAKNISGEVGTLVTNIRGTEMLNEVLKILFDNDVTLNSDLTDFRFVKADIGIDADTLTNRQLVFFDGRADQYSHLPTDQHNFMLFNEYYNDSRKAQMGYSINTGKMWFRTCDTGGNYSRAWQELVTKDDLNMISINENSKTIKEHIESIFSNTQYANSKTYTVYINASNGYFGGTITKVSASYGSGILTSHSGNVFYKVSMSGGTLTLTTF